MAERKTKLQRVKFTDEEWAMCLMALDPPEPGEYDQDTLAMFFRNVLACLRPDLRQDPAERDEWSFVRCSCNSCTWVNTMVRRLQSVGFCELPAVQAVFRYAGSRLSEG